MAASLTLFSDAEMTLPFQRVQLRDMAITEGVGLGEPQQIWAYLDGGSHLREVEIGLSGEGAENIQLAIDNDGEPAVWSSEGIIINEGGTIFAGEKFSFWCRAVYSFDDREGTLPFDFNVKAKAIG